MVVPKMRGTSIKTKSGKTYKYAHTCRLFHIFRIDPYDHLKLRIGRVSKIAVFSPPSPPVQIDMSDRNTRLAMCLIEVED